METICTIRDGGKCYGSRMLFEHLDLSVCAGEMVAITGRSGSGKTTLLNAIGSLDSLSSGELTVCGACLPLHGSKRRILLRDKISFVFQSFGLIENETVAWNLAMPLGNMHSRHIRPQQEKNMKQAMARAGLELPLKQRVYELSGGEQQRLAVARVLMKPSRLVLCDEPTGSLDPETGAAVISLFETLKKEGKALIIATHDDRVCARCDRVYRLDQQAGFDNEVNRS